MSIADKLTLLINTKQDIKSAISEKGVEVTGGMTTYADAIRRIETGGGGDSIYVPVGLKFGYSPSSNIENPPKFALPKLILADGYTDGSNMFYANRGLTSINGIYTTNSSLVTCRYMFDGCESLTPIPQLDTSNVKDMFSMFSVCKSLTTIPLLNTSNVTNMGSMFLHCIKLTTIPLLNTSNVINMGKMFDGCKSLTTIPQLDTSSVKGMVAVFSDCVSLTTIPLLNTSSAINMEHMFDGCKSLTTIPLLNTSNVTNMQAMFAGCDSLTTIPQLDTSNVTNMKDMFANCSSLISLPLLDTSNVTNIDGIIYTVTPNRKLTDLGGFKNLKIDLLDCLDYLPNLTVQSLMNVINNLYDFVGNGESTTRILNLGTTNLNKLTAEQKAVATNKGWVLA